MKETKEARKGEGNLKKRQQKGWERTIKEGRQGD
jgi:hypothetical protein